jgi:hypothetical protein
LILNLDCGEHCILLIIEKYFVEELNSKRLSYRKCWITRENIDHLLTEYNVPRNLDLISIDLDGNDYWIWEAIEQFTPRVVVIEYNATFPPDIFWIMKYNPDHRWDGSSYFGASLKALVELGREKGYSLIGCDYTGTNAYFIHESIDLKEFQEPFSPEYHYEPPRYYLRMPSGHIQGFGPGIYEL